MAVAIASQAASNWALINDGSTDHLDITLTKPTGVAVGDLLVAVISRDIGDFGTDTPPSGWTILRTDQNSGAHYVSIYYKIATSTEVAASDFTFVNAVTLSPNMAAAGIIFRITGHSPGTPIWASAADVSIDNTAAPSFSNSITPAIANSMLFIVASGYDNNNAIGGYAIATSNPSWTEVLDQTANPGTNMSLSIATATRPEVTATGNSSVTGGDVTTDWVGILFAIPPENSVTVSETATLTETITTVRSRNVTVTETVTLTETVTTQVDKWKFRNKNDTDWTYRNKHD
jgi:hypothetical protein